MSPTRTISALDRIDELRAKASAARQRVDECQAAATRSQRMHAAASAALRSYFAGVEAGERSDNKREAELRRDVAQLEARMVVRSVSRRGAVTAEYVDQEAEGRLDGARAAAEDAESAVGAFIAENREQVEREMIERSVAARDELVEAFERLDAALGGWRRLANRWRDELLPRWGQSPAEVPSLSGISTPVGEASLKMQQALGGAIDHRGLYPMPASLAPGAEDEERHTAPLPGWEHVPRVVTGSRGLPGF